MTRKQLAAGFRGLAHYVEGRERHDRESIYTCYLIANVLGFDAFVAYRDLFEFHARNERLASTNERLLWDMTSGRKHAMRVMMLCFAAALVEAGDL